MRKSLGLVVFVGLISFALGGVAVASHDFPDVPDSNPFHEDISWMAASGITEGFPDGTFKPGQPVTRQSMAAFMRRLAGDDPDVDPMVNAAELDGRLPADYDNAVTLDGRAPADYDNAVSLNGRTPADYDDAVTLAGRTPADFDNAVSLNGRTPADYDNAVSLNGRTPADYDDAVTLQGKTPDDLLPFVRVESDLGLSVTITGTPDAPTLVTSITPPSSGTYLLSYYAAATSTFDSSQLTCRASGFGELPGMTGIALGDNVPTNLATQLPVTVVTPTPIDIVCFRENFVGSGQLNVKDMVLYLTRVQTG